MGKSYKSHREDRFGAATSWVALEDIHISDSEVAKLLARDFHQINEMRQRIERGEELMPVSLHERASGGVLHRRRASPRCRRQACGKLFCRGRGGLKQPR